MSAVALPVKFQFAVGTTMDMDTGVVIDQTDDGQSAARDLYDTVYYDINARWPAMTREDWAEFRAFLIENRNVELSVTIDGEPHTVRVVGSPRISYAHGAGMVDVQARLRGTRDV